MKSPHPDRSLHRLFLIFLTGVSLAACVPQNQFATDGTGTTAGTSTSGSTSSGSATSVNSCADLSAYDSLSACKTATYAQCYPSTKIVQNKTAVCYFPASGWENCASNPAQWNYGSWGAWCVQSAGIYVRTRTATCQRPYAACDCITDAFTTETCPSSNCTVSGFIGATQACNSGSTATPTPTPTATPSWCSNVVLNYQTTSDSSSESALQSVISTKYPTIISYFSGRGYHVTMTRGSTYGLAISGPITSDLISDHYVIQIEAKRWGCFIGSNGRVTISVIKNGTTISSHEGSAGCISFSNVVGSAAQDALNHLNAPTCQ